MAKGITLAEGINIMDRTTATGIAIPFSITFCTLDRKRRTGGRIRHLKAAVRCGARHSLVRNRQIAVRPADGSGHPIPIHLKLITRINSQPVL